MLFKFQTSKTHQHFKFFGLLQSYHRWIYHSITWRDCYLWVWCDYSRTIPQQSQFVWDVSFICKGIWPFQFRLIKTSSSEKGCNWSQNCHTPRSSTTNITCHAHLSTLHICCSCGTMFNYSYLCHHQALQEQTKSTHHQGDNTHLQSAESDSTVLHSSISHAPPRRSTDAATTQRSTTTRGSDTNIPLTTRPQPLDLSMHNVCCVIKITDGFGRLLDSIPLHCPQMHKCRKCKSAIPDEEVDEELPELDSWSMVPHANKFSQKSRRKNSQTIIILHNWTFYWKLPETFCEII